VSRRPPPRCIRCSKAKCEELGGLTLIDKHRERRAYVCSPCFSAEPLTDFSKVLTQHLVAKRQPEERP
jgi:hypothetical protein